MQYPQWSEEGGGQKRASDNPRTGVRHGCEPPCELEAKPGFSVRTASAFTC